VEVGLERLVVVRLVLPLGQRHAEAPLRARMREAILGAQHTAHERPFRLAPALCGQPALVEAVELLAKLARTALELVAFWLAAAQPQLAQLVPELLWLAVVRGPAVVVDVVGGLVEGQLRSRGYQHGEHRERKGACVCGPGSPTKWR